MKSRGLSLIELLVVLLIVALLVGLLLPSLAGARRKAQGTVCGQQVRQLVTAAHAYASDFQGRLPTGPATASPFPPALYSHLASAAIWTGAPDLAYTGIGASIEKNHLTELDALFCPGEDTLAQQEQIPLIGTPAPALSSYAYRSLAQTQRPYIDDLGKNSEGRPATALFMDAQSLVPDPTFQHTTHHNQLLSIGYADGHVVTLRNEGNAWTIVAADVPSFLANLVPHGEELVRQADALAQP